MDATSTPGPATATWRWFATFGGLVAIVVLLEIFGPRKPDGTVEDWQYLVQMSAILLAVAALVGGLVAVLRRRRT